MSIHRKLASLTEYVHVEISGRIQEGFTVSRLLAEVASIEWDRIKVWPLHDDDLPKDVIEQTGAKLWFNRDEITELRVIPDAS